MLKRLTSLFSRKPGQQPAPQEAAPAEPASIVFRPVDDPGNPFAVGGFDVLTFVNSMLAITGDESVAASFVTLRGDFGNRYVGQLPEDAWRIDTELRFPFNGEISDGAVFKAAAMEDKWDIYLYGNRLYFCRSWTGMLTYVAEFSAVAPAFIVRYIWSACGDKPAEWQLAIAQVDYLIKSHLHSLVLPHPLPADLDRNPQVVGLYSFSQYGRRCCFGTFENTIRDDMRRHLKPPVQR